MFNIGTRIRYPPTNNAIAKEAFIIFNTLLYSILVVIILDKHFHARKAFNPIEINVETATPSISKTAFNTMFTVAAMNVTLNAFFAYPRH